MISTGEVAADLPGTRFGGLPLVPEGFLWPACHSCESPMQFVGQIDLLRPDGEDARLLSIFMCNHNPGECPTWAPDSGANRAFVFTGALHPVPAPPEADPDDDIVLPSTAVELVPVDTTGQPREYDWDVDYDLAQRLWWSQNGDREDDLVGQLGGVPSWVQSEETPDCPSCGQAMTMGAQLMELGANFGTGDGYAFHCPDCRTAAFLWQC